MIIHHTKKNEKHEEVRVPKMKRQHRIQEAPWMQKNISMTFGCPGVRLLGFGVPGLGLRSGLRPAPHKFMNVALRSVTTFCCFPVKVTTTHICAPSMECETFTSPCLTAHCNETTICHYKNQGERRKTTICQRHNNQH